MARFSTNPKLIKAGTGESAVYRLPLHGIEVSASASLDSVLEFFLQPKELQQAVNMLGLSLDDAEQLKSTFLILPENDGPALEGGLLAPADLCVGQAVPWRNLRTLALGTYCVIGAPFDFVSRLLRRPFGHHEVRKYLRFETPVAADSHPVVCDLGDIISPPQDGQALCGHRLEVATLETLRR